MPITKSLQHTAGIYGHYKPVEISWRQKEIGAIVMIIGKRGSLVILRGTDAIIAFAGGNKIFALVSNSSSASKPCTGKPRNKHSMIPILHWLNLNQNLIVNSKKYRYLARLKNPPNFEVQLFFQSKSWRRRWPTNMRWNCDVLIIFYRWTRMFVAAYKREREVKERRKMHSFSVNWKIVVSTWGTCTMHLCIHS